MPRLFNKIVLASVVFTFMAGASSCGSGADKNGPTQEIVSTSPSSPVTVLSDLQWLVGNWQIESDKGIVFENWKLVENGGLVGISGFIKGTDTEISETISIEQRGQDVLYIPTVKGQNNDQPVPFTLTIASGDSFVFENPTHDFPDKITYYNKSATELTAKISGKIKGEDASRAFLFSRK
jgi:hypothetical protein